MVSFYALSITEQISNFTHDLRSPVKDIVQWQDHSFSPALWQLCNKILELEDKCAMLTGHDGTRRDGLLMRVVVRGNIAMDGRRGKSLWSVCCETLSGK